MCASGDASSVSSVCQWGCKQCEQCVPVGGGAAVPGAVEESMEHVCYCGARTANKLQRWAIPKHATPAELKEQGDPCEELAEELIKSTSRLQEKLAVAPY